MTKAEFEMYRLNVNFPVCNPKLFAGVNGCEFVKTALFFNSFSNSKLLFYFTSCVMRVTLSVLFFASRNGHRNSPRNIQLDMKCVTLVQRSFSCALEIRLDKSNYL